MHGHRYRSKFGKGAWPFIAMMSGARGWDSFGPNGPFGPSGPFGPAGPFGPGGPFGEGGRRRRGRMFGPGELRLVLLKLIADEPRHGYELIKAIEEMTGGGYAPSPGTIYPTLSLLQDEGAIAEAASDDTRKAYEATEAGRTELAERADEVDALMDRLGAHGEQARGSTAPHDLFRAAGNLANVLKHKYKAGEIDEAMRQEIVDMIDELAKRIERL